MDIDSYLNEHENKSLLRALTPPVPWTTGDLHSSDASFMTAN